MLELNSLVETNEIHKHTKRVTEIIKALPLDIANKVKEAFVFDPGWVFSGADFASLEDRISALTTKDPNKLKVYMGHVVYEINIDGTCHHIRDDATICYDGMTYTGEQFYERYGNK